MRPPPFAKGVSSNFIAPCAWRRPLQVSRLVRQLPPLPHYVKLKSFSHSSTVNTDASTGIVSCVAAALCVAFETSCTSAAPFSRVHWNALEKSDFPREPISRSDSLPAVAASCPAEGGDGSAEVAQRIHGLVESMTRTGCTDGGMVDQNIQFSRPSERFMQCVESSLQHRHPRNARATKHSG